MAEDEVNQSEPNSAESERNDDNNDGNNGFVIDERGEINMGKMDKSLVLAEMVLWSAINH